MMGHKYRWLRGDRFEGVPIQTLPTVGIFGDALRMWLSGGEYGEGISTTCSAGRTVHVWMQGKGGALTPGRSMVLLPSKKGETRDSPAANVAPLRQALMEDNPGHVKVVVCESDYHALKRGIEHLAPMVQ